MLPETTAIVSGYFPPLLLDILSTREHERAAFGWSLTYKYLGINDVGIVSVLAF